MQFIILFFVTFSVQSQEQIDTLKIVFFENSLQINHPDVIRDNIITFDETHQSATEIFSDYLLSRFSVKLINEFNLLRHVVILPIDSVKIRIESDSTFYLFIESFSLVSSSKQSFNKRLLSDLRFQFRKAVSDEMIYFNNFRMASEYYNNVTLLDIQRHVDKLIFAIFDSSPFKRWKNE